MVQEIIIIFEMIGDISRAEHIYIVCGYTDMRKSIDGLAAIVQREFDEKKYRKNRRKLL